MHGSNLLALFGTILNHIDPINENHVEQTLYDLARDLGISYDVIEAALYCDRQLVVYEP